MTKRINGGKKYALAPRNVVVGTLCVVAAAALVMGRPTGVKSIVADLERSGKIEQLKRLDMDPVDRALLAEAAAATSAAPARTASTPAVRVETTKMTAPASAEPAWVEPQPATAPENTLKMVSAPAPVANQSASVSTSAGEPEEPAVPVTLAGCVERNDDGFWLKNASGEGAPSSRSWKSGFLRKRSHNVALVDRGYTHRLATYVGQRVETTGVLADREMRVKTLKVLGSCD